MTLNPIGHSVGQHFTVPSAVQGHERLHSPNVQPCRRIFIPRFSKKDWRSNDFWVSLHLPIIFASVPGHGDKSTPLNPGCILQFIWTQESREQLRSCKPFPDLKLVIAHIASLQCSQLNASPARTLPCRSSPLQWRRNYGAVIAHLLPGAFYIPPGVNPENLGESSSAAAKPHLEHVLPH